MATLTVPTRELQSIQTATKLLINNEWVASVSGKTFPTINPATGEEIAQVAEAGDERCAAFEGQSGRRGIDAQVDQTSGGNGVAVRQTPARHTQNGPGPDR